MRMRWLTAILFALVASVAQGQVITPPAGGPPTGPAGGALSGTYPNPTLGQPAAPNQARIYLSPNCGTQTNCYPISTTGDNAAAFATAFAAANSYTQPGTPTAPMTAPQTGQTSSTSLVLNLAFPTGSTVYVFVWDSLGKAITITPDTGGATFSKIGSTVGPGPFIQLYGTNVRGGVQANNITLSWTGSEILSASAVALPGVSANVTSSGSTGSSTTPSVSQSTTASNGMILSACGWYNASGGDSLTSTAGTLLTNLGQADNAHVGLAMWGTFQATVGSVTSSGTLGTASATWACQSVEVQGGGAIPVSTTIDIANGYYSYSSGISLTTPGEQLELHAGTSLNYIGSAHAADVGVQGLVSDNPGGTLQRFSIDCDNGVFTGGANMTAGIYEQPYNHYMMVKSCRFENFGNSSAYQINATCENWDIEIGPNNWFGEWDGALRNNFIMNSNHCTADSFARIHDNVIACLPGPGLDAGCSVAQAGIGFVLDGDENRFYHNNIAFKLPLVKVICSNPHTSPTCLGNQIDQNQMEAPMTGTTSTGVIQFSNQSGMLVTQNVMIMQATGASPITPVGGTDVLSGARINFNTIAQKADAVPIVTLNNVTLQTGNTSYGNNCTTALAVFYQCPVIHTTGSNISQWTNTIEGDVIGTLTKCAANGTSVSASAVACGSASAGLFSVPITTPTSAVVTTTALTATSTVYVHQRLDTVAGTALGVTCNTTTNATVPNISAMTATTFTIPLSAFSTNPGCYEYLIIN